MLTYSYYAVGAMVMLLLIGSFQSAVTADRYTSASLKGISATEFSVGAEGGRQNLNLSDYIWEESVYLLPQAWDTTFISGVANGLMDPNFYADYVLQDAIYCRRVAQLWEQLAKNESVNQEIRDYANESIAGFHECSVGLFERWSVKDDGGDNYGVIIREPVTNYVAFIEDAMVAHAPNVMIATYACLKLWNNLTGQLVSMVNDTNPFGVWAHENHGSGRSMRKQAAQMDEWDKNYQWYDWSEARDIFRSAMKNEINFFDNAGNFSASVASS